MFSTPKGPKHSSGLTGLSSPHFTPSGRRSIQNTPRHTPSIINKTFRAEQILEETLLHVLKAKNSPVPVQVQEVLRNNINSSSIKLHDSGWAWLVSGHKAYLWKHSLQQATSVCHRLTLPSCSTVSRWTASLLSIHTSPESTELVGIVGVSPEGFVRYWRGGTEDIPYKEIKMDMGGDLVHSVTDLEVTSGFAVLTEQGVLMLLKHSADDLLSVIRLEPPKGMLLGISKRVSSFLFGGGQTTEKRESICLTSCSYKGEHDLVYILTNSHVQLWNILSVEEHEQEMLYDVDFIALIRDAVMNENWFTQDEGISSISSTEIRIWLLDCQSTNQGIAILFAVICTTVSSPIMKYGLTLLPSDSEIIPYSCGPLIDLHYEQPYQPQQESRLISISLQCCTSISQAAVYSKHFILPVQLNRVVNGGEPRPDTGLNRIDIGSHNVIIGSGTCHRELLFFTLKHGVISLTVFAFTDSSPQKRAKTFSSSFTGATPTLRLPPPTATITPFDSYEEETEQLKNAFMFYLNNSLSDATSLCANVFPSSSFSLGIDTPGDVATMKLSEMILNDLPSSDPRWNDGTLSDTTGTGSTSLIIIYQLQDKLEAHTHFVQFLIDVELLDKLTCVTVRGRPMNTRYLLCEHAEKISASMILKRMHNRIIEEAVKILLQLRPPLPHLRPGLTAQDIFYSQEVNEIWYLRSLTIGLPEYQMSLTYKKWWNGKRLNVDSIEEVFEHVLICQDNFAGSQDTPIERLEIVVGVASIIEAMFSEAVEYRKSHSSLYKSYSVSDIKESEYIPWTASVGYSGTRALISKELQALLDTWTECKTEPLSDQHRQSLWSVYCDLADLLFAGYQQHLTSIVDDKDRELEVRSDFDNDRNRFILASFEQGQANIAIELAEQYQHFPTLVQICEHQKNRERLETYFTKFGSDGFGEFLFKYYLDNGNLKQLLSFSNLFPKELGSFISSHSHLSWLHYLATEEYNEASKNLVQLAEEECQSVAKKKTLLSLGKLALFASSDTKGMSKLQDIDSQLMSIDYQENAPTIALENADIDIECMPPLPPEKIVELYVEDSSSYNDFLCSLEFLDIAFEDSDDPQFKDLKIYIWSRAILRNDWNRLGTDNPLENLQSTFFFKIVEGAYLKGLNIMSLLPDIDDLFHSPYLIREGLTHSTTFLFLMRACYEQVERITDTSLSEDVK